MLCSLALANLRTVVVALEAEIETSPPPRVKAPVVVANKD